MVENAHSAIDGEIVKNEYVTLLDSILGKRLSEVDPSLHGIEFPYSPGPTKYSEVVPWTHESGKEGYMSRIISEIMTPEGKRFYPGEGRSSRMQTSMDKARMDVQKQAQYFPSDSLSTDIVNQLMQHGGLFK
jgi:hypothetical protein